jgi:hypothetical protein
VRFRTATALLVFLPVAGVSPAVRAQAPGRAAEFDDLGFTRAAGIGARATAMRTFAATSDDVTALVLNSAGLARVRRISGAVVVAHETARMTLDYGSGPAGDELSATRLSFAGVAVPLPVLRGSLVPAFSVHRAFSSERALSYARNNTSAGRMENFSSEQSGATYAYTLGMGTDLSPALSAGVSIFMLDGNIDLLRQFDWQPLVSLPTEHTFVVENSSSDVGGYGAQIGFRLYVHERVQMGITVNSPTVLNVSTHRMREETKQIINDIGTFTQESSDETAEYILPYRVEGGVAFSLGSVRLTAQAGYTDWSNAALDGRRVLTSNTDAALKSVVSLAAGVEWTLTRLPLRLRAGFENAPSPLKYLVTDRIDGNSVDRVQSESGRTSVAAGAAIMLHRQIALDVAWVRTSGSRTGSVVQDDYSATLFALQGSYYF